MFKKLTFAFLALFLIGGSTMAFAWWDNLRVEETEQSLLLGEGVRIELDSSVGGGGKLLVPAGSYYAGHVDYTTEYAFTYTLGLASELDDPGDVQISIENFQIEGLTAGEKPDALIITIAGDGLNGVTQSATGFTLRIDNALKTATDTLDVTVTFTLVAHPNETYAADYEKLAGKNIDFTAAFDLIPVGE